MAKNTKITRAKNDTAANVGYEAELWQMADALRGNIHRRRAASGAMVPDVAAPAVTLDQWVQGTSRGPTSL
jgi:hypothetical protein